MDKLTEAKQRIIAHADQIQGFAGVGKAWLQNGEECLSIRIDSKELANAKLSVDEVKHRIKRLSGNVPFKIKMVGIPVLL